MLAIFLNKRIINLNYCPLDLAFGPHAGFFFMKTTKSAIFYFDAQNFYRRSKEVFSGIKYPNFDPVALSNLVAQKYSLKVKKIRFYTGVPPKKRNPYWNRFWSKKLAFLGRDPSIKIFTRKTQTREKTIFIEDKVHKIKFDVEKGIDTRITIDIVRDVLEQESEAIVIFSEDQDLSEAVAEIKKIAKSQNKYISIFSASPPFKDKRGISGSKWIKISESDYNQCIDKRDYR